jgi:hypothetical protein
MVVTSFVLILGFKHLYPWADPEQAHRLTGGKSIYLSQAFVIARFVIFGLGCLVFKNLIVGNSLKQDETGDNNLTLQKSTSICWFYCVFLRFSFQCFRSIC